MDDQPSPDAVADALLARAMVRFSRASGPGGQHRDHTESRAELVLTRDALEGLPEGVIRRLVSALHLEDRPLRLSAQADRSKERNRSAVETRLRERVVTALTPRAQRRPTSRSRHMVARRLDQKARRGRVKDLRSRPGTDD